MVVLNSNSSENLISSNHFLRDNEPWIPLQKRDNRLDDEYGLVLLEGSQNSVIGNHFSEILYGDSIKSNNAKPVIVQVSSGTENYISNNNFVGKVSVATEGDSAFDAQVGSLLEANSLNRLELTTVLIENTSIKNTVLDSGHDNQVLLDKKMNAFRPTPMVTF